ncbi:MAG: hypothetical protein NC211_06510 [Alistipes senegalensis]|nr:sodium:glutamate symporter [Oxalobacter formigenes]MCM1281462.1 hypothetical protein [Alistipes senegalensis]
MAAILSFCALCLLLLAGMAIRSFFPLLQRLYLPASVIGGFLGLAIAGFGGTCLPPEWLAAFGELPGFLINIIFAGLFIGAVPPALKTIGRLAGAQFCFSQILAWGQYVIGLGMALFLLGPLFGTPAVFGNLIEIGFAGGHGTVGGLSQTFRELGWPAGVDLGYTVATCGMVLGILIGMVMVNIGVRKGFIRHIRTFNDMTLAEQKGIHPPESQPPSGRQTVSPDVMDSLGLHLALTGLAILIGCGIKTLLVQAESFAPAAMADMHIMQSLPLFPMCMIGGLLLQLFLKKTGADFLADSGQMNRITGAALDFLVVAAIASIRLEFVAAYWLPLLILVLAGIAWNLLIIIFIGPHIFSEAWFERSLAEFGQAMGVTATGLMLLRTVDPENKTVAAQAFGYKQLLHEPVMGGGLWTSLAVPLVMAGGGITIWLFCLAVLAAALICWRTFFFVRQQKTDTH